MKKDNPMLKLSFLIPNLQNIISTLEKLRNKYVINATYEIDEKELIEEIESIARELNSINKQSDTFFRHFLVTPKKEDTEVYSNKLIIFKKLVPNLLVTKKADEVLKLEKKIQEDYLSFYNSIINNKVNNNNNTSSDNSNNNFSELEKQKDDIIMYDDKAEKVFENQHDFEKFFNVLLKII
jgi:hypothetical protein